ncbi:VOC family protein [Acetobacterium woodii]|uniref:Putative glyoxalase/bleomycin resistance protein/dioxygenase n=1 Tax=Acetobacterium woodii (strain ATCC 29683 / DSM 1030 / JCM 2381 / KCTC 1655 / WB1) TaxID=931626 RepID=H6LIA0_ACEWD|nr:VOC family protein [Acetobacterium woodii]AFA47274.1 putative glyoxalase/bleomycin resistance protein/dioxygenase [Acetobacterium woodii DSM 1030]
MKCKFTHTNIIAKDWKKLSQFYQEVFGCVPVPPERDLHGDWINRLTGLKGAHIRGEHLRLPGYEENLPTLEIFSYENGIDSGIPQINRTGFGHIAFEVNDVDAVLKALLAAGGGQIGERIVADYPDNVVATFVYATDPEGNIVELQNWGTR